MSGIKVIATNRKAARDFHLEERHEAGLVLTGTEIKSIRAGRVNLSDGYVQPRNGELWLLNVHIAPYDPSGRYGHEPRRPRKLLLHRREINRLIARVQERGYTIVPVRLYLKDGLAKVEIALARGKRKYDKRQAIAKRDAQREIDRELKERYRR
ncbi:MAG: SsrA-binding protein [Chloroflexi bacterium]|nr:MAG: SsrA-binding protein [Chloroflexota bacterium]RLC83208.1 MAG: SsrA-binding protein [Chloroflexota bacterium]HEY68718.1 SsrA-binding protein SmpB [Thermoflexia bacterium]